MAQPARSLPPGAGLRFDRVEDLRAHVLSLYGPLETLDPEDREELTAYLRMLDELEARFDAPHSS